MVDYYYDYTNGTDGSAGTVHDGLKEDNSGSNYTAEASTDTTSIYVSTGVLDNTSDDDYNGDYLYNVTRSTGVIISDFDADDGSGNSVITTPSVTGQTSGDTFFIIRARKTFEDFVENSRNAGDRAFLRGGQTFDMSAISDHVRAVSSGSATSTIKVIGCDGANYDPWYDGTVSKPIMDGGSVDYYMLDLYGVSYWEIDNLDFKGGSASTGAVASQFCRINFFKNCTFRETDTGTEGIRCVYGSHYFENCTFKDTGNDNQLDILTAIVMAVDCNFDKGSVSGTTAEAISSTGIFEAYNCTFGATNQFTGEIFTVSGGSCEIRLYNCFINTTTSRYVVASTNRYGKLYSEDHDQVSGDLYIESGPGDIINEDTVLRSGGSGKSLKYIPRSGRIGDAERLGIGLVTNYPSGWRQWCAAEETTITIYVRGYGWTGFPTADQLFLHASYISGAGARTVVQSTETISDNTTWTALTVTFTPSSAGWVYLDVLLGHYESSSGIYVDLPSEYWELAFNGPQLADENTPGAGGGSGRIPRQRIHGV